MTKANWTSKTNGKAIEVVVEMDAIERTTSNGFGGEVGTGKYRVTESYAVLVDGAVVTSGTSVASASERHTGVAGTVAVIGKMVLTAETLELVEAAKAKEREAIMANNAGYAAYIARREQNDADMAELDKSDAAINQAMGY